MKRYSVTLLALGLFMLGCGQREAPRTEVKPIPAPVVTTVATASFVKGQVKYWTKGTWQKLAMQQALKADDSLEVPAKAEVELKDNAGTIVKLTGPAKGTASTLMAGNAAQTQSATAKALAKVKKLENTKQTFQTQTPTAVAGIRGIPGRKAAADTSKKDTLPK